MYFILFMKQFNDLVLEQYEYLNKEMELLNER